MTGFVTEPPVFVHFQRNGDRRFTAEPLEPQDIYDERDWESSQIGVLPKLCFSDENKAAASIFQTTPH